MTPEQKLAIYNGSNVYTKKAIAVFFPGTDVGQAPDVIFDAQAPPPTPDLELFQVPAAIGTDLQQFIVHPDFVDQYARRDIAHLNDQTRQRYLDLYHNDEELLFDTEELLFDTFCGTTAVLIRAQIIIRFLGLELDRPGILAEIVTVAVEEYAASLGA